MASASAQGYSDRLSPYSNKGDLNLQNEPEPALSVLYKVLHLAALIKESKHVVFHTGAGISTSAGIPDFRGPDGIWTRETTRSSASSSSCASAAVPFEETLPTLAHVVLSRLMRRGYVAYVISQNVDNLHVRSGVPRESLSELHGNLFVDWCRDGCGHETYRDSEALTVGHMPTGRRCPACDDHPITVDKALDWEDALPEPDYERAQLHACKADLHIVAGTSCQMTPARNLPFLNTAVARARRAIVNLSRTEYDHRFGTTVRHYTDAVFAALAVAMRVDHDVGRVDRVLTFGFVASVAQKRQRNSHNYSNSNSDNRGADGDGNSVGHTLPVNAIPVNCSARVKWDGEWVRRERVYGIVGVKYALSSSTTTVCTWSKLCTAPGFHHVMHVPHGQYVNADFSISAQIVIGNDENPNDQLENVVTVNDIPLNQSFNQCSVDVVTRTIRHDLNIKHMVGRLQQEASRLRVNGTVPALSPQNVFVAGPKRGWAVCVFCKTPVWSSSGKRERHITQCVRSLDISLQSLHSALLAPP